MKGRPTDQLVYEYMFPKPRATDPQNFHALLQRYLILEVRQEVHSFYGHIDTQEAKYPGLDYCHPTHRIRLSRWPWHRRLFRALDNLRLTPAEIAGLTKWEGTKWAKERFEKEQGITIKDTTDEGFPDWVEPEDRPTHSARRSLRARSTEHNETADQSDEDMKADDSDDEVIESVGVALNEQLRERVARREAGDTSAVLDEEWEQWLKSAIERGELPFLADHIFQASNETSLVPQNLFPPRMLTAARAGQWQEIPEFLHDIIRRSLQNEAPESDDAYSAGPTVGASRSSTPPTTTRRHFVGDQSILSALPGWRRTYSDLRLPVGDSGTGVSSDMRVQRRAQAPGA